MTGKSYESAHAEAEPLVTKAASASDCPGLGASMTIRIARPTDQLDEVIEFYRDGLGLRVIANFEQHAGYSGVILEVPNHQIHLEFTHTDVGSPCPAPTKDNLLVLYIPIATAFCSAVNRLEQKGYVSVEPENPYWRDHGKTFEDPDGWRVVLYHGTGIQD